jgi:hypothetical protein
MEQFLQAVYVYARFFSETLIQSLSRILSPGQKLTKNTLFLPLAENPEQAPGPR